MEVQSMILGQSLSVSPTYLRVVMEGGGKEDIVLCTSFDLLKERKDISLTNADWN